MSPVQWEQNSVTMMHKLSRISPINLMTTLMMALTHQIAMRVMATKGTRKASHAALEEALPRLLITLLDHAEQGDTQAAVPRVNQVAQLPRALPSGIDASTEPAAVVALSEERLSSNQVLELLRPHQISHEIES